MSRAGSGARRGLAAAFSSSTATVYYVLLAVVVVSAVLARHAGRDLFSSGNVAVIMTSITVLGLVAIGQTHAILVGSLDLSVASVLSLTSVLAAGIMAGSSANIPAAVAISLLVAAVIGLVNGFLVGVLQLNGFIVTLGTGLVVSGYLSSNYRGAVGGVPSQFTWLGSTDIGIFPITTLAMLALLGVMFVVLRRTRLGYHVYGVGGDREVTRMSGIANALPIMYAHAASAVFAGLAGLTIVARLGVGSPVAGSQGAYDVLSIAAVVLGGCSLAGGRGSLWGTLAGILIFAVIDSTMSILQVNPFLKDVVRGAVIVAAVAVFARRSTSRRFARFSAAQRGVLQPRTAEGVR
jgi:ribose transport system permease protein